MDEIAKKILDKLTFAEKLDSLLEEIEGEENVISDVLKELIRKGMVATVNHTGSHLTKTEIYYDSDHMNSYAYIITAKGLTALGH